MNKAIFLDIDGVLNSNFWNDAHQKEISDGTLLENENIHIVDMTPDHSTEEIRRTKRFSLVKAREILAWLSEHRDVEKWVVIDDLDLHNEIVAMHQIQTNPEVGLTFENIQRAKEILL